MLIRFSFRQSERISGSLLNISFSQREFISGSLLKLSFRQKQEQESSLLKLAFTQEPLEVKRRFKGSQTFHGGSDYDIRVRIGGVNVNICELADKITIRSAENEANTAKIVIRKQRNRRNPRPIDLHQWHGRDIVIDYVDNSGSLRLYRGKIDNVDSTLLKGHFVLICTDRREKQIKKLPKNVIRQIGYTSKSAHGDEFKDLFEEFERRMETVPASFDFDAHGQHYLTPWQPKARPDYVLSPCVIYEREPTVKLASVGGVLNAVDVQMTFSFHSLRQRELYYQYILGLNVCQYTAYRRLSSLDAIADAVAQTGWTLGGFTFNRAAKSGYYNCNGSRLMHRRDVVNATFSDSGRYSSIRRIINPDVVSGTFEAFKRWTQTIRETYTMTLRHRPSIARYEETRENMSYNVSSEAEVKWDEEEIARHQDSLQYTTTPMDEFYAPFQTVPYYKGQKLNLSKTKDWYLDLDNDGGELEKTWQVAYHTALTKMWASHRQNTIDLQVKAFPQANTRQTHRIEHSHINAVAKVAMVEHTFDFNKRLGSTALTYKFFQNGNTRVENQVSGSLKKVPRPPLREFSEYSKNIQVGRHEIPPNADISGRNGMIYEIAVVSNGRQQYNPVVFQITTPEIEAAATDTLETSASEIADVPIPNDYLLTRV